MRDGEATSPCAAPSLQQTAQSDIERPRRKSHAQVDMHHAEEISFIILVSEAPPLPSPTPTPTPTAVAVSAMGIIVWALVNED